MTDAAAGHPSSDNPNAGRLVATAGATPALRGSGSPGLYGYGVAADGGGDNFLHQFYEYLRVLYKRRWLMICIIGSVVALGVIRTLMQTPLYTSTVRIQIERNAVKVIEGGSVTPTESSDPEFLRTQYELLQSYALAERVASSLKLGEDANFLKPRDFSVVHLLNRLGVGEDGKSVDKRALEASATRVVIENRTVRPVPGSRLVDIRYSDPSPDRAQRIANSFADAFIAAAIEKRFQASSYAKTFLEDQLAQLKLRLEDGERAMLDFSEREQIILVNERASIAENNLAAANATLGGIIAERIKNEQLWRQVEQASGMDLPQFLTNATIAGLRVQRNALNTEYREKLETFKPAYPAMVEISNKIKEIDRQLAAEIGSIKSSLKGAYEASLALELQTKEQIERLRQEVLELQKKGIQYNTLKREADTTRTLYNNLLQRFKEVDIAGGVSSNNIFVVDKALRPRSPSSPGLLRALLVSFAIGLGGAFGVAVLLERLDDRISSPDQAERITGLTTLGLIPKVAGLPAESELDDAGSAISEAYRSLCTSLQFASESGLPKTILVTSSGPAEGKSVTAKAIAQQFAALGLKVLLIDADLRNPSLHTKFGLEKHVGLSNYLAGACTPPEAMQSTSRPHLAFIAAGPLPPNPADLLGGARLLSLFSVGLEVFDLIVVDGPPVMGLADAQVLASATAATIFVISAGQARAGAVRGALRRLELARAPVIGTVLTKFDAKLAGYGYGYGYGSSYGYGDAYRYGVLDNEDGQDTGRLQLKKAS